MLWTFAPVLLLACGIDYPEHLSSKSRTNMIAVMTLDVVGLVFVLLLRKSYFILFLSNQESGSFKAY